MRPMPRSGITIARWARSWRRYAAFVGFCSRPGVSLRSTPGYSSYAAPRRFVGRFAPPRPFIDAQKRECTRFWLRFLTTIILRSTISGTWRNHIS